MANNNEDEVWRTIGGRKVFIKEGQSLSDAMIKSGKFKKGARESYRKAKEEDEKKTDKTKKEEEFEKNVDEMYNRFHGKTDKEVAEEIAKERGERILTDKEQKEREVQFMKNLEKEQYESEFQEREKKIKAMNPNDKNYDVEKNHLESQQRDLVAKINELDKKEENEHNKKMLKEMERRLSKKDLSDEQREKIEDRASKYESAINEYESNKETKQKGGFYTRKDGTKEYDPHKGTEYEIKYDSMEDVMKDPNSAMNKYIREQNEKKAYKKYLKLHPESEMSFEEFKKQK